MGTWHQKKDGTWTQQYAVPFTATYRDDLKEFTGWQIESADPVSEDQFEGHQGSQRRRVRNSLGEPI